MANSYSAPNFIIDTDIDEAGLATLKGGAVATTDLIYCCEGAKVTLGAAGNFACYDLFAGDNPTGTAVVKTGYFDILNKGGYTVTLHSTGSNPGFNGVGSTSKFKVIGAAGNNVIIKSNTNAKCTDYNVRACANEYQYVTFQNFLGVYVGSTSSLYINVTVDGNGGAGTNGFNFHAMPATFTDNIVKNIAATYFAETIALSDDNIYQLYLNLSQIGTSAASRANYIFRKNGTNYLSVKRSDFSFKLAPAWSTTTGIQSLVDSATYGFMVASWSDAVSARGDNVLYNIYVRKAAAPDSFGVTSSYYYGSTAALTATIASDATGAILDYNATYHVIVRAFDGVNEDTNTTALTVTVTNMMATIATNQDNLFALIAGECFK